MRGELGILSPVSDLIGGSSPLARGTPASITRYAVDLRFIPACAGNSSSPLIKSRPRVVHPRLRGELARRLRRRTLRPGSSPLARGTPLCSLPSSVMCRFIPACAGNSDIRKPLLAQTAVHPRLRGNSRSRTEVTTADPVHPRLRGELHHESLLYDRNYGSSPLARGTLTNGSIFDYMGRFIPACAGNSLKMVITLR